MKTPQDMTPLEWARHMVTPPYNCACPYCIAGKRPNTPHVRVMVERNVPMLSADYGFISDPGGVLVTILVVSVAPVGVRFAAVVDAKGALPIVVTQLAT